MGHLCNYFCQDPVHAINLLTWLRVPYETLSTEEQAAFCEDLLLDIRTLEKNGKVPWVAQAIERLLPVQELSPLEFYQQNHGWNLLCPHPSVTKSCRAYVALVRYVPQEVSDAVS